MKKHLIFLVALFALAAIALVSCQDEEDRTVTGEGQLSKSSPLTQRLQSLTANKTTVDNVIDSTDCFSIKLPVQLIVSGEPVSVDNQEGYAVVAQILQSSSVGGTVDFVFPITVIDSAYNETPIFSQDEFDAITAGCQSPQTIGCLTVNYPITVSTYDTGTQTPAVQTIDNDQEFFTFLLVLPDTAVYEIDYSITTTNAQGIPITISGNEAFNAAITTAVSDCACDNPGILTNDLIVYIPFANEIADLTGFSTPQQQGEVVFVTDRSGNPGGALSFVGSGQVNNIIVSGNPNNDLMQSNAFTVSLWFNRQDAQMVDAENLMDTEGLQLGLGNPNSNEPTEVRSPFVSTPNIEYLPDLTWEGLLGEIGVWHHVVVTWDGEVLSLYRNAQLGAEALLPEFPAEMPGAVFGGQYRGYLDDIRIYKRALSITEIGVLFELEGDVNTCLD